MIEQIGRLAERVATSLSRRGFLGRVGQGALVLGGAFGGLLGFPGSALAARGVGCCTNKTCPKPHGKGLGNCIFAGTTSCLASPIYCVWNCPMAPQQFTLCT